MKQTKSVPFIGSHVDDLLSYVKSRKRIRVENDHIHSGDLSYRFDERGRIVEVKRKCKQCRQVFSVKRPYDLYNWCDECGEFHRWRSKTERKSPFKDTASDRVCLCCGKMFRSKGSHNRRCAKCAAKLENDKTNYVTYKNNNSNELIICN